jgi:7-carboxy-7-deazaguanine synthase
MKVVEIFNSIDGEGKRAGDLVTFIRLAGCNLGCPYCDTKYSWGSGDSQTNEMSVDEIVNWVMDKGFREVTLTGGEPLIHQQVGTLINKLVDNGCEVNVETNGSIDISKFRIPSPRGDLFFTVDYKCPSSKMEEKMYLMNFRHLQVQDVLKFVVGNKEDLDKARLITDLTCPPCLIYISPVFGEITPAKIVEYMTENRMTQWRIQLQLHKFIWDPMKRGV